MKSWILCAVLCGASVVRAAGPATTLPAAEVESLIVQLNDDNWRVRQAAQDQLVALGDAVGRRIERLSTETAEEEVRTRASAILRQIETHSRLAPTPITLHLKDAPPKQAIEAIAQQAKVELAVWPDWVWKQAQGTITVDADREPFWVVLNQVCDQAGLSVQTHGGSSKITIQTGRNNWSRKPRDLQGCFIITADHASRNHHVDFSAPENISSSFSLNIGVLVDPKLRILRAAYSPDVVTAKDENGNSLVGGAGLMRGEDYRAASWGATWRWDFAVPLVHTPQTGKKIAVLKGALRFMVQEKSDLWEIPNIAAAKNLERTIPIGKYIVQELKKNGKENYELKISIEHDRNIVTHQNLLTDWSSLQSSIRLLDAEGRAYQNSGGGGGGDDGKLQYTINFFARNDGGQQPGDPVKLIWEIPTATKEMEVPFEFRDLPIP